MINWTIREEIFWFCMGMIYAIACCDNQMWVGFSDDLLLAWWREKCAQYQDMPEQGTELYDLYCTAFLEGEWAYMFHPRQSEDRLFALQGQMTYHRLKRDGHPCDDLQLFLHEHWKEIPQEQRDAIYQGLLAAQAGHPGEAYSQYDTRPRGYNEHLPRLLSRSPEIEGRRP